MNRNYLLGLIGILLGIFGFLLVFQDDDSLYMTSVQQIYSIKKTSDTEYIYLEFQANQEDSMYFQSDYVTNIYLYDESTQIPLSLKSIQVTSQSESIYSVVFEVHIPLQSNDYIIQMEDTYLHITYANNHQFDLLLGEFNYGFLNNEVHHISLQNLVATYDYIEGINSVTGLMIDLYNTTDYNVKIIDLSILSTSVDLMNDFVIELDHLVDPFTRIEDILGQDYSFYDYETEQVDIIYHPQEETILYAPLTFHGHIHFIERFSILITYEILGQEYTYVIDDFPFMDSYVFSQEYEELEVVYEWD